MSILGDLINIGTSAIGAHQANQQYDKVAKDYTTAQNKAEGLFNPFLTGGTAAFGRAVGMTTPGYQYSPADPSYAFTRDEATQGLQRQFAAHGGYNSGGEQKALARYIAGLASQNYGADFNRNLQLGQMGYGAAQDTASAYFRGAEGRSGAYYKKAGNNQDWWKGFGSDVTDIANQFASMG